MAAEGESARPPGPPATPRGEDQQRQKGRRAVGDPRPARGGVTELEPAGHPGLGRPVRAIAVPRRVVLAIVLAVCAFGSAFPAVKVGLQSFEPGPA